MDLPVLIDYNDSGSSVDLPHCFLDHLLEEGYDFGEGILCLKLTSPFSSCYCCMKEFTRGQDTINISLGINMLLNIVDGTFIHVERVKTITPYLIKLQGHNESFGEIKNIKEQLECLFVDIKIVNSGATFYVQGPSGPEPFNVVEILLEDETILEYGLTINTDVKIDFQETLESIRKKDELKAIEAIAALKAQGNQLGGLSTSRSEWLARIQQKH